jgi:molybdopterin-containing oxidoreductase family iron-sulfur binding subunit
MPRYGLVFDLERCIGCHACIIACKVENGTELGSLIRVEMLDGQPLDTARGHFPELTMHYLPLTCMHCQNPPCMDVCPTDAIYQWGDGVVILDIARCNGCQACLTACPYGVIHWVETTSVAAKCNLCAGRIEQGLPPFCVLCCETEAIYFGDLADPQSRVSRLIVQRCGYTLKPEEKTEPVIYYLPPLSRQPV